ncbi:unnamed protein product [Trifolium pratense]|uniref:Uncharacterized protein n=1 Tax=Trifolium pratense TaxID=57577 RepID=A0ACB0LMP1_TRIPR|nr:unnamed protein product [Trifolium pratense]
MAANYTQSIEFNEPVNKVWLRFIVDKERNKVLFAEAGKDFVDALFSFLTLPLGTIARIVAQRSNVEAVTVGSLSSLYQSVENLDPQFLQTHACKDMLLKPRNSMEAYCQKLKLNIDNTEPLRYFMCENLICRRKTGLLSTFSNQNCSCGNVIDKVVIPDCLIRENGFVQENASFIICDDLHVMPNVIGTSVHLLRNLGVDSIQDIQEKTMHIRRKEVIDLLKLSMLSKTPLTDFMFRINNQFIHNLNPRSQSEVGDVSTYKSRQMIVKVLVRKSTREVLYAEVKEDFVDLLLSFLTFPLGGVLHMLEGLSSVSSIDNLYNSMIELSSERHFMSPDLKKKLIKPLCAAQFELRNQILPIAASCLPTFYYSSRWGSKFQEALTSTPKFETNCNYEMNTLLSFVDPKFCMSKSSSSGEYAKGPAMFMVTDNLVVTPMSSVSALSYLNRSNVPLFDLKEKVIKIGVKECLSILKASLTSTSALTNGLSQFIRTNRGALANI